MKTGYFPRPFVVFLLLTLCSSVLLSVISKSPFGKNNQNKLVQTETQWVNEQFSKLTLEQRIAQSFMVACWSNKGAKHLSEIESQIETYHIGGLIFFQGERTNLVDAIDRFQSKSEIPLLIGMDAEWGIAMRIENENRFPYAQTIGAANDLDLTTKMGQFIGLECDQMGIHLNFAPDADVNLNPKNPVIGYRSFGSEAQFVAKHTAAFVTGLEQTNVLSCVKHFPGHGDTDKDSHFELPTVNHSESEFRSVDFVPFKSGIAAGTSSIMVAHLNVPNLDNSGTPSSLSKKVIQTYLRKELNFKGLVISDALNMKAITNKYGKSEAVAMAYAAGCDVLLYPESISEAIELIVKKVNVGEIKETEVELRCKNVLKAKYKAIISKPMVKRKDLSNERDVAINQVFEKAITVIQNKADVLPIDRLDRPVIRIGVGPYAYNFRKRLDAYSKIEHHYFYTIEEAKNRLKDVVLPKNAVVIVDLHATSQRSKNQYGFGNWESLLQMIPEENEVILSLFGNPLVLDSTEVLPASVDACILAYENHPMMQDRVAQFIMGAFNVNGKLESTINSSWKKGMGLNVKGNGRLKYTLPEEEGISSSKLKEIDEIAEKAIAAKALPGCQIVVAVNGKIIHQKSYGTTIYDGGDSITNNHIYDIASITKIASSTMALMKLKSDGKFDEQSTLKELVPDIVGTSDYGQLVASDLLTHQAGLTPWIAFYKKTLVNGNLDPELYATEKKSNFETPVAKGIWIRNEYWKTMLKTIVETPLSGQKKYEYSDLGYYFFKAYIEQVSGMPQNEFVSKNIYKPLGLQHMTYLPLRYFPAKQIVPTENDLEYRKQVIQGYVHDPGAAMMGGVAGHAGLFSNSTDLAALMQVLLNKGQVGNFSLIKKEVVEQFTKCQFCPGNRRGLGFDKPTVDKKNGPTSSMVSSSTFGHSGFTGTIAWADPENKVNYVFLSNRVYPKADNWKITNMSVRTEVQRVIYEALAERTK